MSKRDELRAIVNTINFYGLKNNFNMDQKMTQVNIDHFTDQILELMKPEKKEKIIHPPLSEKHYKHWS